MKMDNTQPINSNAIASKLLASELKAQKHRQDIINKIEETDKVTISSDAVKEEPKFTKEIIRELLKRNVMTVKFTKVDGSEREMRCTLKSDCLPEDNSLVEKLQKPEKKENPDVLNVWDLDKEGWRSFRVANVIDLVI